MKQESRSTGAGRWSELDGLRCLAVFGVLANHFAANALPGPWGHWGVWGFFVLSGFLITHGLLEARERIAARRSSPGRELGRFFLRRALRLWPLYYLVVAGATLCRIKPDFDMLSWNLLFGSNYYVVDQAGWPGLFSHFWSLSVEQQFYLFWPFVVLFAPTRCVAASMMAIMFAAPAFRAAEFAMLMQQGRHLTTPPAVLLPMCADALALGGLLAWTRRVSPTRLQSLAPSAGTISLLLLGGLAVLDRMGWGRFSGPWSTGLEGTLLAIASALLLLHCVDGPDSKLRRFLRLRPLVYIGTISYGVYILHNFMHRLAPGLLRRVYGQNYFDSELAHVTYMVALSLLVAALSWHLFEKPIQRLGARWSAR